MKNEKRKKKHYFRNFLLVILVLAIGVGGYYYYQYAWGLRFREDRTTHTKTTTKPRYSMTRIIDTLSVIPNLKENAFQSYENEKDYGTYVIPGLIATRTINDKGEEVMCTSMTPQGVAVIENYVLVSAYCHTHRHNTVIYVIDKTTHEYVKEIILPGKPHGGSIAYDPIHKNIWICSRSENEAQVVSFTLQDLEEYRYREVKGPIEYRKKEKIQTISSNSFMTYYKGYLYMGYFSDTKMGGSEKFKIMSDGSIEDETSENSEVDHPISKYSESANVPKGVQGITFHDDKLILSISDGPYVPSKLRIYQNGERVHTFNKKNMIKEEFMPERMEQVYIDGNDLYVLFESASNAYHSLSISPCDRILKFNLSKVLE